MRNIVDKEIKVVCDVKPKNISVDFPLDETNRDSVCSNLSEYWKAIKIDVFNVGFFKLQLVMHLYNNYQKHCFPNASKETNLFKCLYNELIETTADGVATCKVKAGLYKIIDLNPHIDPKTLERTANDIKYSHTHDTERTVKKNNHQNFKDFIWKQIFDEPDNAVSDRYCT